MTSDSTSPDSTAALAAQVADLRGKLAVAEAWQIRHAGLSELPAQVAELTELVTQLLEDHGPLATAPYWLGLSDDEYETELAELSEWVSKVLRPNYPAYGKVIRPCWSNHQDAVWELGNLRAEWTRIYDRERPELAGALNWHDRWLPGVITRLEPVLRACTKAQCVMDAES